MSDVEHTLLEQDVDTLSIVISEAQDHLETIEEKILALESAPDDVELINDIFRPIHSIKGNAGFIGYRRLNALSHETETLLDHARKGRLAIDHDVINVLLEAVDGLKALIGLLAQFLGAKMAGEPLPDMEYDIGAISRKLDAILHRQAPARSRGRADTRMAPAAGPTAVEDDDADGARLGEILIREGAATEDQVAHALQQQRRRVGDILVERGAAAAGAVEAVAARQAAGQAGPAVRQEAVKVNLERLDTLIDLVGELSIAQTMLVTQRLHQQGAEGRQAEDALFDKLVERFGKLTQDIQDRAMAMRMVPIKQTFQKIQRLVRDLAHKSGKEIDLDVAGEETEIDKTVVEELGDPLVHLVRNAVDHGLEGPDERRRAGKPRAGRLRLEAYHAAGHIVIELADDGRGIDPDKVLAKAVERGLAVPDAQLSDQQIYQLLFLPGFSTAAQVTELSGRGVGMDVVKRNIERLRGRVEVHSRPGLGTTFVLKLPLTLAIIDGMIVELGGEQYVIPLVNIVQSVRLHEHDVRSVNDRGEYVQVRGMLVPIVRLHALYAADGEMSSASDGLVVVVSTEDGRYGALLVDELLGQQQVVVKSLGDAFRRVRGVSGASIMGDGRVALILDVPTVLELAATSVAGVLV